jgi:hypothetical protein
MAAVFKTKEAARQYRDTFYASPDPVPADDDEHDSDQEQRSTR